MNFTPSFKSPRPEQLTFDFKSAMLDVQVARLPLDGLPGITCIASARSSVFARLYHPRFQAFLIL